MTAQTPTSAVEALRAIRDALPEAPEPDIGSDEPCSHGGYTFRQLEDYAVQCVSTALAASQEAPKADSPEDRFEQYVLDGIARSPEPLRELGEYLTRVLDEDQWPAAERLLLQLATATPTPPASQGDAAPAGDAVRALVDEWSDDDTPILRGEAAAELREALKQSAPGTDVIRDMRLLAAVGIPVAPECVARWAESLAARCDGAPGVETVTDACLHTLRKTAALPDNAGWIAAVTPQDARAILAALAHAAPPEADRTACDPLSDRRITVTGQTKAEEALRAAHAAIRDRLFADSEREALTLLHRAAMRGLAAAPAPAVREAVGEILPFSANCVLPRIQWLVPNDSSLLNPGTKLYTTPPAEAREPAADGNGGAVDGWVESLDPDALGRFAQDEWMDANPGYPAWGLMADDHRAAWLAVGARIKRVLLAAHTKGST